MLRIGMIMTSYHDLRLCNGVSSYRMTNQASGRLKNMAGARTMFLVHRKEEGSSRCVVNSDPRNSYASPAADPRGRGKGGRGGGLPRAELGV